MTSYENGLEAEQEDTKTLSFEHEVDPAGGTRLEETNDEDVPKDNVECGINKEWIEPDIVQWRSLLQFLDIDKEPEHIQFLDFEGKEFVSIEQAESFYFLYAKMMGFSVRKKLKREDKKGILHIRSWVCSNEGFREQKYCNLDNRCKEACALTRMGCNAEFRINLNRETNRWITKCFNNHHNHKFAFFREKPFLRSNIIFRDEMREQVMPMKRARIKTSQIWTYMVEVHDGWENMGCIKDDLYKGICKKYSTWDDFDTSTAMGYLEAKKGRTTCFSTSMMYGKPLVILLGSNNHDKTCVFGAALLDNELQPHMIGHYKEEEWEDNWKATMNKYRLTENAWVESQYGTRKQWADTFLRGIYFGGATATSRCESMNEFLKRDLQNKIPLWMFIRHFDHALSMLRHNEMKEHYKTNLTEPVLNQTTMPCVEDEISSIFTREIFTRIRKEIRHGNNYIVLKDDKIPDYTLYLVKKYIGSGLKRKVLISNEGNDVRCDCYFLETKGIPCRHIFISLKNLERRSLPICLVNRRWLKDAKEAQLLTQGNERKCHHPEVIENSRYGGVTTQTTITLYLATRLREAFQKAMKVISEFNAELEKMPPDEELKHPQNAEGVFPNNILDSQIKKNKRQTNYSQFVEIILWRCKEEKTKKIAITLQVLW
ncbi:protein FAR1-RELATED SEQUENCE 5-like [Humulus lupulus]|uniref:protein FAR1-RELATED SEQUENCE 5-like n=1 Tax=Humulus lupulus TaxID=3486 RepID=UPI002B417107|nr:protein FAR1-RELATED SEQUENCE 5-like [Humulus lupulus]